MYFKKKSLDFEYHVANDLNMIDLVTNSSQPSLGSPWVV